MSKVARITNDGKLLIKGELIEKIKEEPLLYFNGTGRAVTIPNTNNRLQPHDQFTWEMWFKLDGYTQYNTLMGFSSNNLDFGRMDATTQFQNHTWDSNGNQTFVTPSGFPSVNDGEWHHYAIVWDGVKGKRWGFIDGVQRYYATMGAGTNIMSTSPFASFTIGGTNGTGRLIKGWIKEVRMWQKTRTQAEILSTMNTKLTGGEDGLFMYLPLDEGRGSTVIDKASGYVADLGGTTWEVENSSLKLSNNGDLTVYGRKIQEVITQKGFSIFSIKDGNIVVNELIEGVEFNKVFSPTDITNCVLWADVETLEGNNGDTVNTLSELVGGNDFTGYGVLNTIGIKSIKFNGNSMATLNDVTPYSNQPRTIIVLGKPYNGGNMFGYGVSSTSQMVDGLLYNDSQFVIHAHGGGYDNIGNAPAFSMNEVQVFSIVYNGTQVKTCVNRNIGEYVGMSLWTVQSPFTIGSGVYGGYNSFNGEIMEVLIYDKALDDTELNTIMDYLGNKRGLLL